MVSLMIDGIAVTVPEGTTILEAAKGVNIMIPSLCYLKGINEIGACRICCVEVEGMERLVTACNDAVKEGMVVHTNSPKVRRARRSNMQLILSQHDCQCTHCVRSGNCQLQTIANDMNIIQVPMLRWVEDLPWDNSFPLIRDTKKCIKCMRCLQVCEKIQSLSIWDVANTGSRTTIGVRGGRNIRDVDCALCGQCLTHCPTGALWERNDTEEFWDAVAAQGKTVVVQVAPAVRAALCESLKVQPEELPIGKILDLLKKLGADYVFDTAFSADLTIMEEVSEFLYRFKTGELRENPMFTSCCPGWVRFLKSQYPHLVKQLSSAKSPQQMFGAVMKSYFAERIGVKPGDMITVSVMPCLAKKGEREMELYYGEYAGHDVDIVLTTREVARLMREAHIQLSALEDVPGDSLMREGSGAGVIFGTSGGVMEAALRTAHYMVTGTNPEPGAIRIANQADPDTGVLEAALTLGPIPLRAAVVSGLGNARRLIEKIERRELHFDFVEVMACPGGCAGGGGQPIHADGGNAAERGALLCSIDRGMKLRFSHENPDIIKLYEDFMGAPMSRRAHMLLHTDHEAWEMPRGEHRDPAVSLAVRLADRH
ncbi:MAG: [FeFe] hydrogenase, group A [Stomatobaculum sp.]